MVQFSRDSGAKGGVSESTMRYGLLWQFHAMLYTNESRASLAGAVGKMSLLLESAGGQVVGSSSSSFGRAKQAVGGLCGLWGGIRRRRTIYRYA
jgi:hypothetical protein